MSWVNAWGRVAGSSGQGFIALPAIAAWIISGISQVTVTWVSVLGVMSVWMFCPLVHWAVCSLIFQGAVCILDLVLCKLCDFQILSPVCGLSPHPLNSIINKKESLTSDSLLDHAFGTFLRTPCLTQGHKDFLLCCLLKVVWFQA